MNSLIITIILLTNIINIELATNEMQREIGLMNRNEWGKIDGMLFIHESPSQVVYWMKDTYLDLYMVFMDKDFNKLEVYKPQKKSRRLIYSKSTNVMYVLEINTKFSNFIETDHFRYLSEKLKMKLQR